MSLGRKLELILFAVGAFSGSLRATVTVLGTTYNVVNIGALTGMPSSAGLSLSNSGYVAGVAIDAGGFQKAFNWNSASGVQFLNFPSGANQTVGSKVNDSGQIIGPAFGLTQTQSVLWNPNGSVANLFGTASATGLNNAGQVTGYGNTGSSQDAFVWSGGSYTDLGFPSPAISSQGYDINNNSKVAGVLNGGQAFGAYTSAPAAFLWSQGSGFTTIATSSTYLAINVNDLSDQGEIVGDGQWNGGSNHAGWKWDALNGFSALPGLPGAALTLSRAVNDSGLIAGSSGALGTIWDQQGNIYKANDLLAPGSSTWNITALWGINDDGWLTGEGIPSGSTNSVAVLLMPVPEPASGGFMLLTCISLMARRRRAACG